MYFNCYLIYGSLEFGHMRNFFIIFDTQSNDTYFTSIIYPKIQKVELNVSMNITMNNNNNEMVYLLIEG